MKWTDQFENTTVDVEVVRHAIAHPVFSFYDHAAETMSLTKHEMGAVNEANRYDPILAAAALPVYFDTYFPNILKDLELYELMPRYLKAMAKVKERFGY